MQTDGHHLTMSHSNQRTRGMKRLPLAHESDKLARAKPPWLMIMLGNNFFATLITIHRFAYLLLFTMAKDRLLYLRNEEIFMGI